MIVKTPPLLLTLVHAVQQPLGCGLTAMIQAVDLAVEAKVRGSAVQAQGQGKEFRIVPENCRQRSAPPSERCFECRGLGQRPKSDS